MERLPLGDAWSVWPWVLLRGAGFPAAALEPLSSPEAARAADELVAAERAYGAAKQRALEAARAERTRRTGNARAVVHRLIQAIERDAPASSLPELADEVEAYRAAAGALHAAGARATAAYERDRRRASSAVREVIADPRFREAIVWQNRGAYRTSIGWLLRHPEVATTHGARKKESLVARYLQRYAAKNDSIGFFGPLGWAELVAAPGSGRALPGPQLLARRTVYFEHWGVDELAAQFARDPELAPDLAPRRMPMVRLDGATLHAGLAPPVVIPSEYAALLAACDGRRTARRLAHELCDELEVDDRELYAMLGELRDRKLVTWTIEIAAHTEHPVRALRALLAGASAGARARMLPVLDELEAAHARLAAASGDPDRVEAALGELDDTFTRLTGGAASRRAGEAYAGRTLVYEDCVRDYQLQLGPEALARVGPALALVLHAARWYTHAIAVRFLGALRAIHAELGGGSVGFLELGERATAVFPPAGPNPIVDEVVAELHARWERVLGLPGGGEAIALASAEIAARVHAEFAAPGPGWPSARLQSPDVMIAARSVADVLAGDATFVLGELHTGRSLLTSPLVLRESPYGELLRRACIEDVGALRIGVMSPKEGETRLDFGPPVPCDYDIEIGLARSALPPERVLAAADLCVVEAGDRLAVQTRDGRIRFDAIAAFERTLLTATLSRFSLVGPAARTPRVTIDNLVVLRRAWRFTGGELPFTALAGAEQLARVRAWAIAHELPRHVFLRVPGETKPVYLDLESLLSVELLAKLAHGAERVTVSEMLPGPDQLWLADAQDRRYTAELRLTAVDPVRWSP